jgi:hypothetical protein
MPCGVPDGEILAFTHIPKCAGTTMVYLLRRNFGWRHMDAIAGDTPRRPPVYTPRDLRRDLRIYPLLRSVAGHYVQPFVDMEEFDDRLAWYTILRDPVRRFLSHYRDNVRRGWAKDMGEWLAKTESYLPNSQVLWLAGVPDLEAAKQVLTGKFRGVGLTERFDESLLILRQRLGLTGFGIWYGQPKNVAGPARPHDDAPERIEEFREEILRRNELDQKLYEFVQEEVWPRQVAEYGGASRLQEDLVREMARRPSAGDRARGLHNVIHRNLVYKPCVFLDGRGTWRRKPASETGAKRAARGLGGPAIRQTPGPAPPEKP